ncbi:OmpA family protein [Rhodophyticola sp. CCM32]|uniref:OmpA family protein n=1 Tax=Rhodophyticola sp. CCM32 TaxID=2916397 RepID=UPI00107F9CCE|nr:OmpA family protein [Rhodophyticola sp. CCM32]QBY01188.1 OmpA family protein [Rhodophyticola sp. CCM32]
MAILISANRTRITLKYVKYAVLGLAGLALTACDRPAGARIDEGAFGNPTMNNVLVMTGQRSYVEDLAERFAAEVPTTINFAFNSSQLDGSARATLRQQASWIRQFPEVQFSVYGHTDLVGSQAYNQRLGQRRARTAVNYLVSQGIERSRLHALVSLGETQPIVATEGRERRNRRTVTEVSGFVQDHPMILDGRYAVVVYRTYADGSGGGGDGGGEAAASE